MRLIDADALMPLFIEKACTMKDRHGVKLGDEWLLNYNDIKDVIDNAPKVDTDIVPLMQDIVANMPEIVDKAVKLYIEERRRENEIGTGNSK